LPDAPKFTDYYHSDKRNHPEVQEEWITFVLAKPTHSRHEAGRTVYWRYVRERRHWLKVIVEDGAVHNAYIDSRNYTPRWEIPDEDR
jgi:hypothetical protein